MLQLSASFLNKAVLSLQTGTAIATVTGPVINPNSLKIEGFYCQDRFRKQQLILLSQDIREILPQGFAVNDQATLTEPEELIRLKEVLELNFELVGKPVVTTAKEKVGKVSDYAVESETMFIQKLYVAQSVFKSLTGGSLSIDRSQIQEITPRRVIVQDLLKKAPATAPATAA
ncbi:MAG TPA: hypothetical protein VM535_01120 [Candidatus Saccharimonadales bacterium]|nr:hypothetical protein [Candidatus Saccharimonadales bacterium]